MKKILISVVILFYTLSLFARGGGGCGGHGGGHGCSHASSHGAVGMGHSSHDTVNMSMNGVGWMDNGKVLIGKFLQRPLAPGIFVFYPEEYPICHGSIHAKSVKKFVFAGSDTLLSYRKDSTEYCHVENYKNMLRKLTEGKIEIYDEGDIVPIIQGHIDNLVMKYYGLTVHVGSVKKLDRMIRTIILGYAETHPIIKKKGVDIASLFKTINEYNNKG